MARTKIEWLKDINGDKGTTWNPVTGCTPASEGCQNCYARRMAKRLAGRCGYPKDEPFKVTLHEDRLGEPLRWKKPRRVFVCSMGDLFHEDVPRWMRFEVMDIILQAKQHTFLILTKRQANMKEFFEWYYSKAGRTIETIKNLWLGVTAENQARADERIPILLQIPAAVRFISVEPMLGPIRLQRDWLMCPGGAEYGHGMSLTRVHAGGCCDRHPRIHWVICGSESGPNHRKTKIEWIRDLREQCISANVPFFLKQMEINGRMVKMPELDGKIWAQFPEVQYDGKKAAGRILDGQIWDEMPEI